MHFVKLEAGEFNLSISLKVPNVTRRPHLPSDKISSSKKHQVKKEWYTHLRNLL